MSILFQKQLEEGNPNWGRCNDGVLVVMEYELYLLARTEVPHAIEVRETHSVIIKKPKIHIILCRTNRRVHMRVAFWINETIIYVL